MLLSTDVFAVSGTTAPNSTTPAVQQLPYYSTTYTSNRSALASYLEGLYDTTYHLIPGTILCGNQKQAFSIIDANFFDGPALEEYNPSMSGSIVSSVNYYLGLPAVNYQHNDRREVLFGTSGLPSSPLGDNLLAITGTVPTCPNGGKNITGFFIMTEIPSTPLKSYTNAMNFLTVAGLESYLEGNVSGAQALFNIALGWWTWNSTYHGFLSPAQAPCIPPNTKNCSTGDTFNTRDLAYFLFFARATRFQVSATILSEIEATLWTQQTASFGGGLATAYNYDGSPLSKGGHTGSEGNGLTLLAYDPRIQTTWWPGVIQTLPTATSVSCSPSSLMVNTPTTCEALVSNGDTSISLPPTGQVSFESSGSGSFSSSGICTLTKVDSVTEGCSVTFTPGPGGEGNQLISADYFGDTYHSSSDSGFTITAAVRTTQLTVSCVPATIPVNAPSSCTITVNDNAAGSPIVPSGSVSVSSPWASPSSSVCTLSAGKCTVQVTPKPGAEGIQALHATYAGDQDHSGSAGDGGLSVTQRSSSTSLVCSPSQVRAGSKVKCTVTVKDSTATGTAINPQGSVSFSANKKVKFNSLSCILSVSGPGQASCSITFTPGSKGIGTVTVSGSFGGDQDHTASAGHASVKVR